MKNFFTLMFTRRLGYTLSIFFCFIMPLIYLFAIADSTKDPSGFVKLKFWAIIVLVFYLIIVMKILKEKIREMRKGAFKRFVFSLNALSSVGIVYLFYSIIESAFVAADNFFGIVMIFVSIGFVLYNMDSILNAQYLQEKEWERLGKEQARIESYKEKYKSGEMK